MSNRCYIVTQVVYSDVELQALPHPPPPPPQSAVEYTSLQTVEYAVVQKKKETALKVKDLHMFQAHLHIAMYKPTFISA